MAENFYPFQQDFINKGVIEFYSAAIQKKHAYTLGSLDTFFLIFSSKRSWRKLISLHSYFPSLSRIICIVLIFNCLLLQ